MKKTSLLSMKPSAGGWSSVVDGAGCSKRVLSASGSLRLDKAKVCCKKVLDVAGVCNVLYLL